jgi:hypothetical protein
MLEEHEVCSQVTELLRSPGNLDRISLPGIAYHLVFATLDHWTSPVKGAP